MNRRGLWALAGLPLACSSNDVSGAQDAQTPDAPAVVDASSDALTPPEGCTEFLPTSIASYRTASAPNAERYSTAPDFSGKVSLGDPSLPDAFVFRLDGDAKLGTIQITTATITPYAIGNSGELGVDLVTADGGSIYSHVLYATSGTITITDAITPWQSEGTIDDVRFDEGAIVDGHFVAKGGACYWIRSLAFDTRESKGCKPFQSPDACNAATEQCMPTNAIGGDGLCVRAGTSVAGDACTWDDASSNGSHVKWDSNCGAGLRCAQIEELGETQATCRRLCNPTAAQSGCPTGTHCGGGYDICIPDAVFTKVNSGDMIDSAQVGQPCSVDAATALDYDVYCGGGSARTGLCTPYQSFGDGGYSTPSCLPFTSSIASCVAADAIVGYVVYKSGLDSSDLHCLQW